jgi:hypothetical protein
MGIFSLHLRATAGQLSGAYIHNALNGMPYLLHIYWPTKPINQGDSVCKVSDFEACNFTMC